MGYGYFSCLRCYKCGCSRFQVATCLVESTWHGLADLQETSQSESRCTCAGSRTSLQLHHQNLESYKLIEWYWTWFIFKIMCVCMYVLRAFVCVCVCIHAISCLHTATIWRAGTEKNILKPVGGRQAWEAVRQSPGKGMPGQTNTIGGKPITSCFVVPLRSLERIDVRHPF